MTKRYTMRFAVVEVDEGGDDVEVVNYTTLPVASTERDEMLEAIEDLYTQEVGRYLRASRYGDGRISARYPGLYG